MRLAAAQDGRDQRHREVAVDAMPGQHGLRGRRVVEVRHQSAAVALAQRAQQRRVPGRQVGGGGLSV
jgi:hypothetical protein